MDLSPELMEKVRQLQEKFASMGQNMESYLEGLLYADYLKYWEYIHLDVLLSLQTPRTKIPDEKIFIIYHQITELYFNLILHAIEQVASYQNIAVEDFVEQLRRMNSYFKNLKHSFEIMMDGMYKEQFLQFRMALLPASGFQSAQYRLIEIASTDLNNLVSLEKREELKDETDIQVLLDNLYWRQGATELATGKKTLTLQLFEEKYKEPFLSFAKRFSDKNIRRRYYELDEAGKNDPSLIEELRQLDYNANIYWPLAHYKTAVRYLQRDPEDIAATGGTNWQKYMPPKNQAIHFFPELFSEEELANWGKTL